MVVAGIVVEYNPLHNGHLYQINKIKTKLNPDYIIVALGNNFTQRGEASVLDKYQKTKLALELGVDMVLEIPTVFSNSSAENFARAGVTLLNNTKVVTHLCFGVETDDIESLAAISKVLIDEPKEFKKVLKENLSKGTSFALARSNAINEIFKDNKEIKDIINKPNNILAIEYIKASVLLKSKMISYPIKRNGPGFYETEVKNDISSATNIRQMLIDKKDISEFVPSNVYKALKKSNVSTEDYSDLLIYKLNTTSSADLENIYEVREGIQNTLKENSKKYNTIKEIIENSKSKRFTYTGISRTITNIILDITKEKYKHALITYPKYIRILGFKSKSEELLSEITKKNKGKIAIITNVNKYIKDKKSNKNIVLELEREIEYNNIYQIKANHDYNSDYTKNMIVL